MKTIEDNIYHIIDPTWDDEPGTWCNLPITKHRRTGAVSFGFVLTIEAFEALDWAFTTRCETCSRMWKREKPEIEAAEGAELRAELVKIVVAPGGENLNLPDDMLLIAVQNLKNKADRADSLQLSSDRQNNEIAELRREKIHYKIKAIRYKEFSQQIRFIVEGLPDMLSKGMPDDAED